MLNLGLEQFNDKRILLLQGPVGPFFRRLAKDLRQAGGEVYKVNFNAGDWLFYPSGAFNYRGTMEEWPAWFETLIGDLGVDVVLLFGDCRPIHQAAHAIALRYGIEIGVFEEGYVRPDYITLEPFGVNGYSRLPRNPEHYQGEPPAKLVKRVVGNTYWYMVWYSFCYFALGALGKPLFRHYRHHRPLTLWEGLPWIRSVWRKLWYRFTERSVPKRLLSEWDQHYFLVPLQVHNDSQITVHTEMSGVEHFIEATIHSFAQHAPSDTLLVFKHHPMDRGYSDYSTLIRTLARGAGIEGRVWYIHDQHLPTLLDHTRGVVVINSTVGLSALLHDAPTKVCGKALYDFPGLTYQGGLDRFWQEAPEAIPDPSLFYRFLQHLVARTQLNGSFYKRLKLEGSHAGLAWPKPSRAAATERDGAGAHTTKMQEFAGDRLNESPAPEPGHSGAVQTKEGERTAPSRSAARRK
ncbi:MAG TPA: capsular biosynthesis protein [Gammaproteobacteria bacterium]